MTSCAPAYSREAQAGAPQKGTAQENDAYLCNEIEKPSVDVSCEEKKCHVTVFGDSRVIYKVFSSGKYGNDSHGETITVNAEQAAVATFPVEAQSDYDFFLVRPYTPKGGFPCNDKEVLVEKVWFEWE